ncbi:uncharacterized protein [Periplaneta americana]
MALKLVFFVVVFCLMEVAVESTFPPGGEGSAQEFADKIKKYLPSYEEGLSMKMALVDKTKELLERSQNLADDIKAKKPFNATLGQEILDDMDFLKKGSRDFIIRELKNGLHIALTEPDAFSITIYLDREIRKAKSH